jgi:3-oxoacyl-[acyl-carrier-protein] synthase-1
MKGTWIAADTIISPLGYSSKDNLNNILAGKTGIDRIDDAKISSEPIYAARLTDDASSHEATTKLERITIRAVEDVVARTSVPADRTAFILSTTKGNISFLEEGQPNHPRLHLPALAEFIRNRFGFRRSLVVSNACISGVMALLVGKRMIDSGEVDHVVVAGVDVLSKFIVSGFQILQAMSAEPCRPFDSARKGINLGEAAAAIVLTGKPSEINMGTFKARLESLAPLDTVEPFDTAIRIAGGGLSNDANHISGPSRTGAELAFAIRQAMEEADLRESDIDFISAHGTATIYNDEMEARAFALAGLVGKPVHSLKGYYGHTLGAAGVVEVALMAESLRRNQLVPSRGFEHGGVSQPLNVVTQAVSQSLNTCLKTASGFGGCNAAIILTKENYD